MPWRTCTGHQALQGNTIFVPDEMNKMTALQLAKNWTQMLYPFGIGVAGIMALTT